MKLALLLCALLFLPSALGAVMISQVLYDPLGTESGGEAVELYNSAGTTVNLSGWWLATDASARDVAFPAGAELSPRGFYLVADAGWARLRDNLTWQTADFEETMTLGNANSGLALYSPLGREDAAGWGNPMDAEMYEGTAAAAAAPGMSLRRRAFADTDDNAADFFESYPLWSAAPGTGHIILLEITVEENAPAIGSVMLLTDDLSAAGIQLAPVPGGNALLQVRANISGAMVVRAVLGNISAELTGNGTQYEGIIGIPHWLVPGNYTLQVEATSLANLTAIAAASFEYLELLAMEVDAGALNGSALGDLSLSTPERPTLRNSGNIPLDLRISATQLEGGAGSIPPSAVGFTIAGLSGTLEEERLLPLSLLPAEMVALDLTVSARGYPAGTYAGSVLLVPERS
ncbi:lamin tail domain-containing protein [Candidatus Woesearchaeota archaeon]|nr:lamin tail domain-containing protein [Candidatus Woesearchaeota archaeon]